MSRGADDEEDGTVVGMVSLGAAGASGRSSGVGGKNRL